MPILAGIDGLGSIHDELELLVGAGLTPVDAFRAATLSPAAFLGVADSIGVVARGYNADLLILEGNPLEDIGNTPRIRSIVLVGRFRAPGEFD